MNDKRKYVPNHYMVWNKYPYNDIKINKIMLSNEYKINEIDKYIYVKNT
jgi:hypothetical protein